MSDEEKKDGGEQSKPLGTPQGKEQIEKAENVDWSKIQNEGYKPEKPVDTSNPPQDTGTGSKSIEESSGDSSETTTEE